MEPSTLGNVFVVGEKVSIPIFAPGATLNWTITDFFHRPVASGQSPITDGQALIEPAVSNKGFYAVSIKAGDHAAETSFAIVAKHDLAKMPGSPFGVMTHFAQNWDVDIMPLIARAGIRSIRDEHYWDQLEKKKGEYVFREQSDKYMKAAKEAGIEPLIALTFANPLYDKGLTPHTEEGYTGFGRYGQEVLRHFGEQIQAVEVWNEYNGTWCKGPAASDRPKYYTELLKASYEHVKKERPDVKVLGGAAVLLPPPYFEGIFKHGGLQYMDGVVIHPYRGQPEGIDEEIRELKALMRKYGGEKPIWVTETGRMDQTEHGRYNVARYLARMYVLLLSENCERVYWYLLRDYSTFKTMGLLHDVNAPQGRYAAAPPYAAYSNLIEQLYGTKFAGRETTQQERTYVMRFDKGSEQIRACWSTVPAHLALLTDSPVTVTDLVGVETTLTPVNGQVFLTLTDNVVYVKGPITGVKEAGGWFEIAPQQTIDLLDTARVQFRTAEPLNNVSFHVGDESATVSMQSRELPLPGQSTSEPHETIWWYTLVHDGKPAGVGGVRVKIADPLAFDTEIRPGADGVPLLMLKNLSSRVTYEPTKITVGPNNLPPKPIKPGEQLAIRYDDAKEATIAFAARPPITFRGAADIHKVRKASPVIDGDAADWNDLPAWPMKLVGPANMKGKPAQRTISLASDEQNLYVYGNSVGEFLQFAVADAQSPLRSFVEVHFDYAKQTIRSRGVDVVGAKASRVDKGGVELSIPWPSLGFNQPSELRFACIVGGMPSMGWGDGLWPGKNPARMPFLYLELLRGIPELESVSAWPLPKAPTPTIGPVIADSSDDYTNVQGKSGWSYGFMDGSTMMKFDAAGPSGPYTALDFKPMDYVQTMWGYEWAKEGIKYLKLTRDGGHPQATGGRPVWAVRRWTSTVDGKVRLSGRVANNQKGDGVIVHVLVDGVIHASYTVGGPKGPLTRDWELIATVKKGTAIDLAITPGPALDITDDASTATMRVEKVN